MREQATETEPSIQNEHITLFNNRGYSVDINERYTRTCSGVFTRAIADLTGDIEYVDGAEWARKHRRMGRGSNYSRWDPALNPFLKEIGEVISSPAKEHGVVVIGKAVQMGATEVLINEVLRRIHIEPTNILFYMENEDKVKNMVRNRFDVAIKQKPFREGSVTKNGLHRDFVDGSLYCFGSNSPSGMSSFEAQLVMGDEVVRYPDDIGGEGDFLQLAKGRVTTFGSRSKIVLASSFVSKLGRGRMFYNYYKLGDQRQYMCPCYHCGKFYLWSIELLKWVVDENGYGMQCPHCHKHTMDGDQRVECTLNGEWFSTEERSMDDVTSFRINGLVANRNFKDKEWFTMATNHERAIQGKIPIQTFYNVQLGLPYEDGEIVTPSNEEIPLKMNDVYWLHRDSEGDRLYEIPPVDDILFLTMGVDVGSKKLDWEIKAWAPGYSCYSIDRGRIDHSVRNTQDCVDALRLIMHRRYGGIFRVWLCAIDSGYDTSYVYELCRAFPTYIKARQGVMGCMVPIKGSSTVYNEKLIKSMPGDVVKNTSSKRVRKREGVYVVLGTDYAKRELYNTLNKNYQEEFEGKVYCPTDYPAEYYGELVAETMETDKQGRPVFKVHGRSTKNEALDLHVYNRACLDLLGYPFDKDGKKIRGMLEDNTRNMDKHFNRPAQKAPEDVKEKKAVNKVSEKMLERKRVRDERKKQRALHRQNKQVI